MTTNINNFDSKSYFLRTADNIELEKGGGSLEFGFIESVGYGVTGAAFSAFAGLANSAISLGESLNVVSEEDAEDARFSTHSMLKNQVSARAADFYTEHQVGVDVAGLVAGSLVPGMLAVKGLRALQVAGKVPGPVQSATGLRNADLVLGSKSVEAAKQAVLRSGGNPWRSPQTWAAYRTGLKQQAMEGIVFESAVLATMNQHSTLNPEGLGYFEAFGNQFASGLPFVALGVGLGTGIDVLRINGAIRNFVTEEGRRVGYLNMTKMPTLEGLTGGDKLVFLAEETKKLSDRAEGVSADDFAATRAITNTTTILRKEVMNAIGEINFAGEDGRKVMETLVTETPLERLGSLAEVMAGLTRVDRVGVKQMEDLREFYDKTKTPKMFFRSTDATVAQQGGVIGEDLALSIDEQGFDIRDAMVKVFGDDILKAGKLTKQQAAMLHNMRVRVPLTSAEVRAEAGKGTLSVGQVTSYHAEYLNGVVKIESDSVTGGFRIVVSPQVFVREGAQTDAYFQSTNRMNKAIGVPEISREEYDQYIYLHELSHLKSNSKAAQNVVYTAMAGTKGGQELIGELLYGTFQARGGAAFNAMIRDALGKGDTAAADTLSIARDLYSSSKTADEKKALLTYVLGGSLSKSGKLAPFGKDPMLFQKMSGAYYLHVDELLADSMSRLLNPTTRELAAKEMPITAKMLNKYGGLARAWDDTQAYYNVRTGQTLTSYLPGIADVMGEAGFKIRQRGIDELLEVPSLGTSFKITPTIFEDIATWYGKAASGKTKPNYMEFNAQWLAASQKQLADMIDDQGRIVIDSNALPMMERLLTLADKDLDLMFAQNNVVVRTIAGKNVTDQAVTKDLLRSQLIDAKRTFRNALVATNWFNEHEIAKILNIEVRNGLGDIAEDGWMMMGKWDMAKPELLSLRYKPMSMADTMASTKSRAAVEERLSMLQHQRNMTAAEILGTLQVLMPKISVEEVAVITDAETRAGMLTNLRTAFESVRTKMASVGRLVEKQSQQLTQEVAERFATFSSRFNANDAGELRYEFAQIDNLIRRDWYYQIDGTAGNYIVRKAALAKMAADEGMEFPEFMAALRNDAEFAEGVASSMLGQGAKSAPDGVKISSELADFYKMHVARNQDFTRRDSLLAASKGRQVVRDPDVLYAPPRDLTKYKHVAFVQPNPHLAGSDPRKYMIFAETEAELENKKAIIASKYGKQYSIFTRSDVEDYKKYLDEYEKGLVFDEVYFDSELARRGTASELIPSMDLQVSGTLDRYHNWHVRKEISQLRGGVEAQYSDVIQYLRQMDEVVGAPGRDALSKKFKEASTIYADSLAVMLASRSSTGVIEDTWVRVNDYIGDKGSKLIDSALGIFREDVGQGITQASLERFNAKLAESGFEAPFTNVMETILVSPDPQVSRALPSLVRTLNNLAGTLMLRMDMAHSIVTLISSPILMMPVLMEAKQALAGTKAAQRLENMTTVINPANGMKEPSAARLMFDATRAFWSPEGRQFMQQLRDRGIVSDYLRQYQEVMDFSQINGRHAMKEVNDKIDSMAELASRFTGFTFSEEFTRFVVAHATKRIGEVRGLQDEELMAVVGSAVDKVHGIYIGHQRPQLFQGVVGQAIGLYQTYFFNFMQNALKYVGDRNHANTIALAGLQSSIFGLQSWPGFQTFNTMIGETNRGNLDVYEAFDANDPRSNGIYFMYGLGSHVLGMPIDFYSRGDLAIRNALIVPNPLEPMQIPAVGMVARAVANAIRTGELLASDNVGVGEALLQGFAHNGMNRPVQGIAKIMQGQITSGSGQIYFKNSNYVDYDMAEEINWASMFARAIGTRPLNESIIMNHYYREAAYQASTRKSIEELGTEMQLSLASDRFNPRAVESFMLSYERAGGDVQSFNAYLGRQLENASSGAMMEFRKEMEKDSAIGRAYRRMLLERSAQPVWQIGQPPPVAEEPQQ
jgi:hypothetical protein